MIWQKKYVKIAKKFSKVGKILFFALNAERNVLKTGNEKAERKRGCDMKKKLTKKLIKVLKKMKKICKAHKECENCPLGGDDECIMGTVPCGLNIKRLKKKWGV